jgi:hypothetical protein
MTSPEADPADVAEQQASVAGDEARTPDVDVPLEAPEADVAEQAAVVEQGDEYR